MANMALKSFARRHAEHGVRGAITMNPTRPPPLVCITNANPTSD